jgi:hypothetical protein
MVLREAVSADMDRIHVNQDKDQWWDLENIVINLWFTQNYVKHLAAARMLVSQEGPGFLDLHR